MLYAGEMTERTDDGRCVMVVGDAGGRQIR
jgi:hypothetical protein